MAGVSAGRSLSGSLSILHMENLSMDVFGTGCSGARPSSVTELILSACRVMTSSTSLHSMSQFTMSSSKLLICSGLEFGSSIAQRSMVLIFVRGSLYKRPIRTN